MKKIMPIKLKYFVFFFAIVILFQGISHTALALEVKYPVIPGFPNINGPIAASGSTPAVPAATLPQFIDYFFGFALILAGFLGVIAIAISGVRILISAGNPSAIIDARERLFGSILGIILLLFSFVILQIINPQLATQRTVTLTPSLTPGLYIWGTLPTPVSYNANGRAFVAALTGNNNPSPTTSPDDVFEPAPSEDANTTDVDVQNPKLFYDCNAPGPNLLVWTYGQLNYAADFSTNGAPDETTYSLVCLPDKILCDGSNNGSCNVIDIAGDNIESYTSDIEKPGVYFYLKNDCQGLSSEVLQQSGDIPNFSSQFNGGEPPVLSMRIVNGNDILDRYGAVLTQHYQFEGECSAPIIRSDAGSECFNIPPDSAGSVFNPFSAHVFKQAQWSPENSVIALYSANLGLERNLTDLGEHYSVYTGFSGSNGYNGTPNDLLKNEGYQWQPASDVPHEPENNTTSPPECKDANGNYTCLNYIQPTGSFNVFLYSQYSNSQASAKACKLFSNGLAADDWLTANEDFKNLLLGGQSLYRMDIIPRPY